MNERDIRAVLAPVRMLRMTEADGQRLDAAVAQPLDQATARRSATKARAVAVLATAAGVAAVALVVTAARHPQPALSAQRIAAKTQAAIGSGPVLHVVVDACMELSHGAPKHCGTIETWRLDGVGERQLERTDGGRLELEQVINPSRARTFIARRNLVVRSDPRVNFRPALSPRYNTWNHLLGDLPRVKTVRRATWHGKPALVLVRPRGQGPETRYYVDPTSHHLLGVVAYRRDGGVLSSTAIRLVQRLGDSPNARAKLTMSSHPDAGREVER